MKLPNDPPPTFLNPSHFSKEFKEFVKLCLQKDPAARPKPLELLKVFPEVELMKCSIHSFSKMQLLEEINF